jgi:colanic acid biosynthesis glycosyl transferase WcaI
LNYTSFIFGSILTSFFLMRKNFDIIFVFEPSPITVCLPAIFLKKVKKIPICFWVLDLWPESVTSAGNFKTNLIPYILNPLVKFIYHNVDQILVSSNGFIKSIVEKGIQESKISFFPQWAESIFKPVKIENNYLSFLSEKSFKIMFAGNIGEAQDFPSILNAAKILKKNKNIQWVILGGGRKEKWVKSEIKKHRLENCFHLMGSYPLEKMPEFYAEADCMLFSLKKEYIFSITIPAKVQTYLACAKPVLGMIDGEAANIINEAQAGLTCQSENPKALADKVEKLGLYSKEKLNTLGQNALRYYRKEFERTMLMNRMSDIFAETIRKSNN